jgi:hypothetical protein
MPHAAALEIILRKYAIICPKKPSYIVRAVSVYNIKEAGYERNRFAEDRGTKNIHYEGLEGDAR